ncbi:MAG: hypothetical protein AB7S77_02000 [Desulfatirhabdiaceae bacterium]
MSIDKLVEFCHLKYRRDKSCDYCPNEDECVGSCDKCLDNIHFRRITRRYNCENIAYYYVCRYIYKYSSEVEYLINNINLLRQLPELNIVSIGCGPVTELFGFLNYMNRDNDQRNLRFRGFDLNNIWNNIHNQIKLITQDDHRLKLDFYYYDVFDIFDQIERRGVSDSPNILFLQYLISDMVAHDYDVKSFIDRLGKLMFSKMPLNSFLIINDINHNTKARDYFEYIHQTFSQTYPITAYRFHFENRNREWFYAYGKRHPSNDITNSIPDHVRCKYKPWDFCSSAQIVIHKRGN